MSSNLINSKSRFAVLAKETNNKNVFNKKDKRKKTDEIFTQEKINKDENKQKKRQDNDTTNIEKKLKQKEKNILTNESFPELDSSKKSENKININVKKEITYLNKIKCENTDFIQTSQTKNSTNEFNDDIEPGWVEISFNRKTREITRRYNLRYNQKNDTSTYSNENKALNSLVETHKKRTQEYINMWGYEEWEKMFRFPNYDYEYFDKLDELYENDMNNYNDMEPEDNDYYSD